MYETNELLITHFYDDLTIAITINHAEEDYPRQ